MSEEKRGQFRHLGVKLSPPQPTYNAGTIVLNLKLWRKHNFYEQLLKICTLNKKHKLFTSQGSQPPLQLLFSGNRFEHLPHHLYFDGLGWKQGRAWWFPEAVGNATFLHWNGSGKPWLAKGKHTQYWNKYGGPRNSVSRMLSYRYLVATEHKDGINEDLLWMLLSKSVVIMPEERQTASWMMEEFLQPYVHFVPVASNYSNIDETIQWCEDNREKVKLISERATLFVHDMLLDESSEKENEEVKFQVMERYNKLYG